MTVEYDPAYKDAAQARLNRLNAAGVPDIALRQPERSYPVILFVDTDQRAHALQRDHDPAVLLVRRIGSCNADRASAIIIEMPRHHGSEARQKAFEEWMQWVPTRLPPGDRARITLL